MTARLLPVAVLLALSAAMAQTHTSGIGKTQSPTAKGMVRGAKSSLPLDKELREIINASQGVSPEFEADVLMSVVESGEIADRNLKIRLLKTAFDAAGSAQQPIKKGPAAEMRSDSRTGFLMIAFSFNLDALSLQSRAVNDLLLIDSNLARALFNKIVLPPLDPLACGNALVYDPGNYYLALDNIGSGTFTVQQEMQGQRSAWILPYVGDVKTHTQVVPIAKTLGSVDFSSLELAELASRFTSTLSQIRGDELSFSAAVTSDGGNYAFEVMSGLFKVMDAKGIATSPLLSALREYLVSNLNGTSCAVADGADKDGDLLPPSVTNFNHKFKVALQKAQLGPIQKDELKDARMSPTAKVYPFWQSADSKQLSETLKDLKWGKGPNARSEKEKKAIAWTSRARDYLTQVNSWSGKGEDESDFFHEKCVFYEALIDVMPPSEDRTAFLDNYVLFLEQNSFQQTSRIEWFWHAKGLLTGFRAPDDRASVLRAFLNSRDSTLRLYAKVEKWKLQHVSGKAASSPRVR